MLSRGYRLPPADHVETDLRTKTECPGCHSRRDTVDPGDIPSPTSGLLAVRSNSSYCSRSQAALDLGISQKRASDWYQGSISAKYTVCGKGKGSLVFRALCSNPVELLGIGFLVIFLTWLNEALSLRNFCMRNENKSKICIGGQRGAVVFHQGAVCGRAT